MSNAQITKIILTILLCISSQAVAQRKAESPSSARQLMGRVVAAYHSFSSYSDKGVAKVQIIGNGRTVDKRVEFETLFKRPGKLRFSWVTETSYLSFKKRYVIWSDGKNAWASFAFTGNKAERQDDLAMAVASATGISNGTAHPILRLLTDDITGRRLDQLRDLKISKYETFDGVECVVLVGYNNIDRECKLWIGRKDFLIRRIFEADEDGTTHDEVRTNITVNQSIPDSRFVE